jgi:hypothetical protein
MTLSADKKPQYRDGIEIEYPVAAGAVIYLGAMVCVNASGYAVPAADTSGFKFVGWAVAKVDNTGGADGAKKVIVRRASLFRVKGSNLAQAQVGASMYVVDDETVGAAAEATNNVLVGSLAIYESATTGWVLAG